MTEFNIITICYNDLNGLIKTINSVKSQTFKNYKHIIIDGSWAPKAKANKGKGKDEGEQSQATAKAKAKPKASKGKGQGEGAQKQKARHLAKLVKRERQR